MESLEDMRRQAKLEHALRSRTDVTRIPPAPVTVRAITGEAIAYTDTQVLVQWETCGDYYVRWEDKWPGQEGLAECISSRRVRRLS